VAGEVMNTKTGVEEFAVISKYHQDLGTQVLAAARLILRTESDQKEVRCISRI
jgi:hypothetical protein